MFDWLVVCVRLFVYPFVLSVGHIHLSPSFPLTSPFFSFIYPISGHNLGTAEVESALTEHPAVAEAAVVGIPHDVKGEKKRLLDGCVRV